VAAALAQSADSRRRLEGIEADDRATLEEIPPRAFAISVRERAARQPSRPPFARSWFPALAAASAVAVAALALWGRSPDSTSDTRPKAGAERADTTRIKGLRPQVLLFRKAQDGVEALSSGSRVRRGDVVQLAYQAAGRSYGAIFSVDGRGVVTQHLPAEGSRAVPLAAAGQALASAYQLDDAPRFEVFYLVTAAATFEIPPLLDAARGIAATDPARLSPLRLPAGLEATQFVLRKEDPR
jgi:hypothetical protein